MEGGRGRALGAAPSTVFTRGEMRGATGTVTRSDDSGRGTRAAAASAFYDAWESQQQGLLPLPQLAVPENSTDGLLISSRGAATPPHSSLAIHTRIRIYRRVSNIRIYIQLQYTYRVYMY